MSGVNPIWKKVTTEYDLEKHLGTGSYGEVLKARSKLTKEEVAIKLVVSPFSDTSQIRKILSEV